MTLIILAILAFFAIVQVGIAAFTAAFVYRWISGISKGFGEFFIEVDQDGVSQFGHFVNELAEASATRIGQNVRAGINGSIGGTMKGVVAELEQAGAESAPELALLSQLPKSIKKNNLAMAGLQWFLQNKIGGLGAGSGSGGNGKQSDQGRFGGF